jgi:hypothetical protein
LRYTIATSPPSTSLDFDHFFGLSVLLDRFPGTRAIASQKSVKLMHEQRQTAAFVPRGHSTLGGDHLTLSAITTAPDGVDTISTLVWKRAPNHPL